LRNSRRNGIATEARRTQRKKGRRIEELEDAVGAAVEEFEEVQVAKDLELLADFVVDVMVLRVEFGQLVCVVVHFGEYKFIFVQRATCV